MDNEGFRLLLAEYAHAVRNRTADEGKLERQVLAKFDRLQSDLWSARCAVADITGDEVDTYENEEASERYYAGLQAAGILGS